MTTVPGFVATHSIYTSDRLYSNAGAQALLTGAVHLADSAFTAVCKINCKGNPNCIAQCDSSTR